MKAALLKRILSISLAILLLGVTLVSCSDGTGGQTADTTSAGQSASDDTGEVDTRVYPELPDMDFDGYTFKVLHWYVTGWDHRMNKDIFAEVETGDPINDAVYKRNSIINDKYNVNFSIQNEPHNEVISMTQKFVNAGEDAYDVVYARMVDVTSLLTGGYFLDLNTLPYVDFSKPWWDHNSVERLSVLGKLYLVASDINIIDKDATAAIAFNKQYAAEEQLPNLYELVENGTWTMDKMMSLYKGKSRDLNGDGQIDADNDVYAFLGKHDVAASFFLGGGGSFVSKDENDEPYLSFESERNYNIAQKIFDIMYDEHHFYNQHLMQKTIDDYAFEQLFPNGHGLFYWMRLDNVTTMRASETDFGILPIPKYDEAQTRYYSMVSVHTSGLITVPKTAQDPGRTGFILEALSAESKYTLIPAYIEVALKGKYVRDNESEAMLDLIFATRTYDLGDVFNFGSLAGDWIGIAGTGNRDVASFYARHEKAAQKAIDKFIEQLQKYE
ncbi:MAG: hypothetical protein ACOYID_05530 [Eubacteriales bacterium]|jgi:hypothetical protein|nr:hypothetical protein [Clostridiales bacterium]